MTRRGDFGHVAPSGYAASRRGSRTPAQQEFILGACPGGRETMSMAEDSRFSDEMWDTADLFFLADTLQHGMPIEEIAGFLNRSEDAVRRRVNLKRGYAA